MGVARHAPTHTHTAREQVYVQRLDAHSSATAAHRSCATVTSATEPWQVANQRLCTQHAIQGRALKHRKRVYLCLPTHLVAALVLCLPGATVVGKTHLSELAYSSDGHNARYGTPINAAAPGRNTGGSSSGSAVSDVVNPLCMTLPSVLTVDIVNARGSCGSRFQQHKRLHAAATTLGVCLV